MALSIRRVLLLVLAVQLAGCYVQHARRAALRHDAGAQRDAAVGAAPTDAGESSVAPDSDVHPVFDAAVRGDSGDARVEPRDTGVVAAVDAALVPDAQPPEPTYPDFVFRHEDAHAGLFALSTRDFSVRRLDPEPVAKAPVQRALGYSPDERVLLVEEAPSDGASLFLSYPCRTSACSADVPRYVPVLGSASIGSVERVVFAPDSSSALLVYYDALAIVALDGSDTVEVHRLSASKVRKFGFLAGGAALVELSNGDTDATVFDLRDLALDELPRVGLPAYELAVAPDGAHFATWAPTTPGSFVTAFEASAVLAGDVDGRLVTSGPSSSLVHASDTRVIARDASTVFAQRWDGSDSVVLPIQRDGATVSCGDHMLAMASDGRSAVSVVLPTASPAALPIETIPVAADWVAQGDFYADCTRLSQLAGDPKVIDLTTGHVTPNDYFAFGRLSPDAQLLLLGDFGIASIYAVDDDNTRLYSPRPGARGGDPVFGHQHHVVYVATGLLDPLEPKLYAIDLSSQPAVVSELLPDQMELYSPQLSANDRYLAFTRRDANVPNAQLGATGLFELDLTTGQAQALAPGRELPTGGIAGIQRVPGQRKLLVMGRYDAEPNNGIYALDLDEPGSWVRQTPADSSLLPVPALSYPSGMLVAPDGESFAFTAGSSEGIGLYVDALQTTHEVSATLASAIEPAPNRSGGFAPIYIESLFNSALGMLYLKNPGGDYVQSISYLPLYRLAVGDSQGTQIATNLGELPFYVMLGKNQRVVLGTWQDELLHINVIEAGDPATAIEIGRVTNDPTLSPDERFLILFPDESGALVVMDLASRVAHQVDVDADVLATLQFQQVASDSRRALFAGDGKLYLLDLEKPARLRLVAKNLGAGDQLRFSDDAQRVVLQRTGAPPRYLDLERGIDVELGHLAQPASDVRITPDGRYILVRSGDDWLRFETSAIERDPERLVVPRHDASFLQFDPSGQYAFGGSYVWRLDAPDEPHQVDSVSAALWVE